jgi:PAS domain S-box-containing protein
MEANSSNSVIREAELLKRIELLEQENLKLRTTLKERKFWIHESHKSSSVGSFEIDIKSNSWKSSKILDEIYGIDKKYPRTIENWINIIHNDYKQQISEYFDEFIKNKAQFYKDFKITRINDGQERWVFTQGQIVLDYNEEIDKVIGSVEDITDRKKIENEIIESEILYRSLITASPDIIVVADTNGIITFISVKTAKILGYDENFNFIGKNVLDWILPIDKQRAFENIQKVLQGYKFYDNEYLFLKKDGSSFYGEINSSPLFFSDGKLKGFLSIIRDISERKKSENELQVTRKLLIRAQDIAKIGYWEFDFNTNKVWASREAKEMYGVSSDELTIKYMQSVPLAEYRKILDEKMQNLIEKGIKYDVEFKIKRINDNAIIDIHSMAEYNKVDNKLFGVIQNITERKIAEDALRESEFTLKQQNEEYLAINEELSESNSKIQQINRELIVAKEKAEESDRLKSAFLANMSHEIRTPMNAILGFSQLLESGDISEEKQKKFAKTIRHGATDLLGIINDIIDIAKIESGTIQIHDEIGNISDLLDELKSFFISRNESIIKKPIEFIVEKGVSNEQNLILADFHRLKQVLINLVENSYKFTDSGQIEFGCSICDPKTILFYVKDTGIGIPKEKLTIIFDRFRQADELYTTRKYGGTGLGLSISKGLIELMNGKIWVDSIENIGSTFYFTIPFKASGNNAFIYSKKCNSEINWLGKSILIVEDIEYNSALIEEILIDTKAKIHIAKNGAIANEIFNGNKIDLVLMDIRLPDTNGFELTRKFKKLNKELVIIAQTAYANEEDKKQSILAGCDGYLSKPINNEKLFDILDRYLSLQDAIS